jgi:hypothetical protein
MGVVDKVSLGRVGLIMGYLGYLFSPFISTHQVWPWIFSFMIFIGARILSTDKEEIKRWKGWLRFANFHGIIVVVISLVQMLGVIREK